jgi:hypothetical protein
LRVLRWCANLTVLQLSAEGDERGIGHVRRDPWVADAAWLDGSTERDHHGAGEVDGHELRVGRSGDDPAEYV